MDKSPKEILAELDAELSALKTRVGEIEKKVELLRNELDLEPAEPLDLGTADYLYDIADAVPEDIPAENVPEAVADDMPAEVFADNAGENVGESVPDDIPEPESEAEPEAEPETEDLPESEPEVEQEPAQEVGQEPEDLPEAVPGQEIQAEPETEAEPEQVAETEPEPEPEDLPEEDGFSLFGGMAEEEDPKARKTKAPSEHRQYSGHKVIADQKYGNEAWRKDMPGPEVKDVRSAISLNDRVMFISTLFRDDSMLFQDVINKINALTTLEKAVQYLKENFPEWDMDSELVYRFMMSVRRKIR
ncbi:MAG: hypothetical protein LKJ87_07165 [Bacteroidales bacterium]|jgi:hypothetical protein|nr:hypothetical protein [Bacteroidales bacterium]